MKKIVFIVIVLLLITGCSINYKEYNDIDNYSNYLISLRDNTDAHSYLSIFPDEIVNNNVEEFRYLSEDGLFDGDYLFYLVVNYDKESFYNEKDRISNITINYKNLEKKILYSEEGFNYPVYISIFDNNGSFEYALADEENYKIIYIFNQFFMWDKIEINKNYEPIDYKVPIKDIKREGYNMYYFFNKNGDGIMFNETY